MKKLNVLFLYWGKKGGGARYSLEIAKELSKQDDIELHLSLSDQCELLEEFKGIDRPSHIAETYENIYGFIRFYYFGINKQVKNLHTFLKKHEIKLLIVGMDFFWGEAIFRTCRKAGVKTILVVHEPLPHPKEPLIMSLIKKRRLSKSIPLSDHIVTLTNHVKGVIKENYNVADVNISVIPHGIFTYHKAEKPKFIDKNNHTINLLYFGRIEYYKGLDILLEAFRLLEEKFDHVRLEVWGSGDLTVYVKNINLLKNIHIQNRWIGEEEIPGIFDRNHICILPYRQGSQSGVIGIASQAAMPIVACPAGGLTEQLSQTGAVITEDFTPESICRAITTFIENPDIYSEYSSKSLQYADRITWESISRSFVTIGQKLIK